MIEKAYAKMNLALNIVDKRIDGYHDIETIMLPLELHDSIEVSITTHSLDDFVTCDNYNVGISKYNLCHKAIAVAREKWGFDKYFDVFIHKNIFLQSGLGGGSGDAAAVLRCIVRMLNLKVSEAEIMETAKNVGSDVPFMVMDKPAIVGGIGEKVNYFDFNSKYRNYYILLVKPQQGISTTEVYNKYEECEKVHFDIQKVQKALIDGDPNLPQYIGNSLEIPAFAILPELVELKKSLVDHGFEMVFMTGGGSCMVAMTDNKRLAKKTLKEYYLDKRYETELTTFKKDF
jgi:4-diphosphocytidyl-2C-methyl-D-erythritol kinase